MSEVRSSVDKSDSSSFEDLGIASDLADERIDQNKDVIPEDDEWMDVLGSGHLKKRVIYAFIFHRDVSPMYVLPNNIIFVMIIIITYAHTEKFFRFCNLIFSKHFYTGTRTLDTCVTKSRIILVFVKTE